MRRQDCIVTDLTEIKSILDGCKTCHVAMVDNGAPYVVPLSYGYCIEENTLTLYFHSAKEGRKIDILQKNNSVCFAISSEGEPAFSEIPCNSGYYFSSIIGDGKVFFIDNDDEKCAALAFIFEHQTGQKVNFSAEQADPVLIFKVVSKCFVGKKKARPPLK